MVDAIYIHIPFCIRKCGYCDFLSFQSNEIEREKYINKLINEIKLYPKIKYDTIYFGGGTPSILKIEEIEKILKELSFDENSEITLEVNPKTVDKEKLKGLKKIGINRLSIGIQTFNQEFLKKLGRIHNIDDGINTYKMAREVGFKNISLDLMFSLPGQNIDDVEKDLDKLFLLNPEHFSIYSLIWEEGTLFYEKLLKGEYKETDNSLEADMYQMIIEKSKEQGYIHYEISNFCKEGKEAKHNTKYWKNQEYIGVGLGASGYYQNIRYKNFSNFEDYYDRIEKGLLPREDIEKVSEDEKEEYRHLVGLRLLKEGILESSDKKFYKIYNKLLKDGYLKKIESNGEIRYILTEKGLFLANEVFEEFV
ncbi:radical SAM family heme chaperone HemW [Fusobacterium perfoetens]|uniref:radical SAM family heme chaperone HemW n=1 Tax=Fusobacterium perfoetens TaxID=852 RepID=UPI00048886DA|nr:radical SAM family heme chaperone HemW [Fusobacterium perfoetens]MCI6153240.1 radical SAM family heme chaperone HemW [Fusobacterium perfoetens]MDY3238341.1 radical SAM family heme chaperone HemW [Fusobacterium perfoetens]